MRYKAAYTPCYVLDPETYNWHIFDEGYRAQLETEKYVTENQAVQGDATIGKDDEDTNEDLGGSTVFSARMSGAMTMTKVEEIQDLGNLMIQVHGKKARAMVCFALLISHKCF